MEDQREDVLGLVVQAMKMLPTNEEVQLHGCGALRLLLETGQAALKGLWNWAGPADQSFLCLQWVKTSWWSLWRTRITWWFWRLCRDFWTTRSCSCRA